AAQVKTEIHNRYSSWTPKPDYFVIIGDHTGSYAVPGEIHLDPNYGDDFATDLYFACMGGGSDHIPDMAHGRISVSSFTEAQVIVDKIINYEKTPTTNSDFYQNALNCAQYQDAPTTPPVYDGYAARRFCHTSEDIRDYLQDDQGYTSERVYYTSTTWDVTDLHYNNGYYSTGGLLPAELRNVSFDWNGGASDITSAIDAGKFMVFHRDHGYIGGSGWAHPYYTTTSMNSLSNGNMLPVVFSMNCHTGEFQLSNCFAEKFLRMSNKGAVGVVAAAYYSYSGYNDALSLGMIDAIWSDPGLYGVYGSGGTGNTYTIGAGNDLYTMGDVVNQGLIAMVHNWGNNTYQHELFHWFGDPAMKIWTSNPNITPITATHPSSLPNGATSISITGCNVADALATMVYDDVLVGETQLSGGAGTITFDPLTNPAIDAILTISKHNHKPYIASIDIQTAAPDLWTGITSTDWHTGLNWNDGSVPTNINDVTIPASALNWPIFTGNFELGTDCWNLIMDGSSQLTVTGDLTIPSGLSLTCNSSATVYVGGDWSNVGTFTTATGIVEFYGNSVSVINTPPGGEIYLIDDDISFWTGNWNGDLTTGTGAYGLFNQNYTSNAGGTSQEARFVYYNSTSQQTRRMFYNSVNTTDLTSITLDFKHMIDNWSSGYTVKVQYSTDGTNWFDAGWSVSPTGDIPATTVSIPLTTAQGVGSSTYFISFTITGNLYNIDYWYIDDVQLHYPGFGTETFYNLTINKNNVEATTNGNINVNNDFTVTPGAYFTNPSGRTLDVTGNTVFEADASGMASYLDNGTTTVTGASYVEQYIEFDGIQGWQWHLVSSPISDATINTYYDMFLYAYHEDGNAPGGGYWENLWDPVTTPMNVGQGYNITGSNTWIGTTTVSYTTGTTGTLNNTDVTITNFTMDDPDINFRGFELVGNPFPCALDWNPAWSMSGLSGWMVILDNGTYRGYHTDGTSWQSGTSIIPSTQGFFVRATSLPASLTIPALERTHNSQAFYKETEDYIYPIVRLEAWANGQIDESVVVFHPEGHTGFDDYYDLSKFTNAAGMPNLYSVSEEKKYAFNVLPEEYADMIIPVHFKISSPGLYQVVATEINNIAEDINVYLEDLKEGTVTELKSNPEYEFSYDPLDDEHRFNLHFTSENLGIQESEMAIMDIFAFSNTVYIKNPALLDAEIVIYNMIGQEIISEETEGRNKIEIPVNDGTGFYLVKVQSGATVIIEKVLIK
ncbi:MAG: T9SS type A sorting domain-containing protein, partial [Bacteroidetes bacterium]|nr:T9SS type A sorting domain-containing protein [Bacteroidota bacterium]